MRATRFWAVGMLVFVAVACAPEPPPAPQAPTEEQIAGQGISHWLSALKLASTRKEALTNLGSSGSKDARIPPAVAHALGDTDPEVRALAVKMLKRLGPPGTVAASQKLQDGIPWEREGAVEVLVEAGDRGRSSLVAALDLVNPDARAIAIDGLKRMDARASLRRAMTSPFENVREGAVAALVELEDDEGLIALVNDEKAGEAAKTALAQRGEAARAVIEAAVRKNGDRQGEGELLRALNAERAAARIAELGGSDDEEIIAAAVAAGNAAVPALIERLDHESDAVRKSVIRALIQLEKTAEEEVATALTAGSPRAQEAAAEILANTLNDTARRRLVLGLGSDDPATRRRILDALAPTGRNRYLVLVEAMHRGEGAAPLEAATVLVGMGPEAKKGLLEQLAKGSAAGRKIVLDACAAAGEAGVFGLVAGFANKELQVVQYAASKLRELGPVGVPALLEAASDPQWPGRQAALIVIGSMGEDAVPAVMDAAMNGEGNVRKTGRELLDKIGPQVVDVLLKRLDDDDPEVRRRAMDSLGSFVGGSDTAVRAAVAAVDDPAPAMRFAALVALGRLGERVTEHAKVIRPRLRDDDASVRIAAAGALLAGSSDATAKKVLSSAWEDDDETVRIAAFRVSFGVASDDQERGRVLKSAFGGSPGVRRAALAAIMDRRPALWMVDALRRATTDEDTEIRKPAERLLAELMKDPWLVLHANPYGREPLADVRKNRKMRKQLEAVDRALDWFARHQSEDGRWAGIEFSARCQRRGCDDHSWKHCDPALTGLALLTFLGNGNTHAQGKYAAQVRSGLTFLTKIQDSEGCYGPRVSQWFQYNHMIAALAMVEAYRLTGSEILRESAQRAVNFADQSQNPYLAWRYGVRDGDNDTSVTAHAVVLMGAAERAGLEVDSTTFKGALGWVEKMTEPHFGKVGYQQRGGESSRYKSQGGHERFPPDRGAALTAAGAVVRLVAGQGTDSDDVVKAVSLCAKRAPNWDLDSGDIDLYYWFWGTQLMHRVGVKVWRRWSDNLHTALLHGQVEAEGSCLHGSWDAVGAWGVFGGRVYTTAMATLCLQAEWNLAWRAE